MKDLNIEELLEKATSKEKSKRRVENHTGTLKYIERTKWEVGTVPVPTYALFWHYRAIYDGVDSQSKCKKVTFFRTISKRFPQYRKNKQRYYLLNTAVIFTEEMLKTAKEYDKQYGQKKKYKKRVQLSRQEGNDAN